MPRRRPTPRNIAPRLPGWVDPSFPSCQRRLASMLSQLGPSVRWDDGKIDGNATESGRPTPRHDLTQGPIGKALLAFAVPTLISSILQSLNGSINAIWVGRFLGEQALAATSNANMIMFLLMAFVFGFGMAATVLIGQAFGRARHGRGAPRDRHRDRRLRAVGRRDRRRSAGSSRRTCCSLLATPADSAPLALAYLRVIFIAMPPILIAIVLMMGLRGTGDSLTPLWFMIVAVRARQRPQPGLHPRPRPDPGHGHRRLGDGDGDRQLCRPDRARRLYLHPRSAGAAARAGAALSEPRPRAAEDDHRQGLPDGPADDRHLLLGAGHARPGQPRGRRDDRGLRRGDAALDLSADAGDGAGRRGERDGGAEYRRRQMGPGERDHPRGHRLQSGRSPACSSSCSTIFDRAGAGPVPRRQQPGACRSRSISSGSPPGASCCSG